VIPSKVVKTPPSVSAQVNMKIHVRSNLQSEIGNCLPHSMCEYFHKQSQVLISAGLQDWGFSWSLKN